MSVKVLNVKGTWQSIANSCMITVGKTATAEPQSAWKRRLLLAEHSPIRKLHINWVWSGLMSWVSVHFVRHKFGIEHWVMSQRDDRTTMLNQTHITRGNALQSVLVDHECEANAQAIINISRKRLCRLASPETQEAWLTMLMELNEIEPELVSACVPDCVYRGWCYEFKSCGFHTTKLFRDQLREYREGVNQ